MYSRLNWFETRISKMVLRAGSTEPNWSHYTSYSKSHSTSWYKYKTEVITNDNANANDHSKTTIETVIYACYKNKSETIGGKAKQQYYKYKYSDTVLNGFMESMDSKYFANIADKYSRVFVCNDAVLNTEMRANVPSERVVPQPNAFNVEYVDFDSIKSDGQYVTGINRSDSTGYLVRDRKRPNLRIITMSWSSLSADEAKRLLTGITRTEWIKVNFLDPLTNENITKMFAITGKSIVGGYRNRYNDLSITLEEV